MSLLPSLFKAEQTQLSQDLLVSRVLQASKYLLASTGITPVCPCLSCTAKPQTVHTTPRGVMWVLNRGNLPQLADNIIVNTAQYAIDFLCYKNTPLTCTQCVVRQDSQVLFCKIAFYPVSPQCVLLSPLKFRTVCDGILLTSYPNKPKSALLKSRAVILLFVLLTYPNMVVLAKGDVIFHVLHEFFL